MKNKSILQILFALLIFVFTQASLMADVNVLVVGSSQSYRATEQEAFDTSAVADQLRSILEADSALGTITVTFDDVYRTKTVDTALSSGYRGDYEHRAYSLTQYYFWPDGRAARLTGIRDADYVVMVGDPYLIAAMPGYHAEGVRLIAEEAKAGGATPILLMPWPRSGSSMAHFGQVAYRIANSLGIKVAPGGYAWDSSSENYQNNDPHPNTEGAYIAAASIYSAMYNQSADSGNALANLAQTEFTTRQAQAHPAPLTMLRPFAGFAVKKRKYTAWDRGTSTESYVAGQFGGVVSSLAKIDKQWDDSPGRSSDAYPWRQPSQNYDFNFNRGNTLYENYKHYMTETSSPEPYADRLDLVNAVFGFSFQDYGTTANTSMLYGMDYLKTPWSSYDDFTDLQMAMKMINTDPLDKNIRNVPVRLISAKLKDALGSSYVTHSDNSHMSTSLRKGVAAYLYTTYSGRIITGDTACRIGSETAYTLFLDSSKVPGFSVLPSAASAKTISPSTTETMTVQFFNPPTEDVVVTVTTADPTVAIAGPYKLLFTPQNYNTPQSVTVKGVPGSPSNASVNILFNTSSEDKAYDGLFDSWAYTNNRTATSVTNVNYDTVELTGYKNFSLDVPLNASGASAGNTTILGPSHGTLSWDGEDVIYTPNADYSGPDGFAYYSQNGGTVTTGSIDIDVLDGFPEGSVRTEITDSTASEEGPTTATLNIIREGDTTGDLVVNFTMSGSATLGSDYTLSPGSSQVTIEAGQSSVQVTLTAIDDTVFGEGDETALLTITAGSGYTDIINFPDVITITDNDNNAPVVEAGSDKSATIDITPWTPSDITTTAWYDAADAATIITSGSAVSQWSDKSGNNNHATQGTSANQPTTGGNIGGTNALNFNGDVLNTSLTQLTTVSIYIVADPTQKPVNNNSSPIGASSSYNTGGCYITIQDWSSGVPNYWTNYEGTALSNSSLIAAGANHAWSPAIFSHSGTGLNSEGMPYKVGADGNGGTPFLGTIGEIIICPSDHNLATRQRIQGYLAHKWGLTANLPAEHPYKSSAPIKGAVVQLDDASVDDLDVLDPVFATWSVDQKPEGAPDPDFDDVNLINATATFKMVGNYVLRLTASDGTDSDFDTVTITVEEFQNTAPVAYAGVDKSETLEESVAWTPSDITTKLWLDATDYNADGTAYTDGTTLSTAWQDKSGNNNDYALVSGPTYQVSELAGNDVVQITSGGFNGPAGAAMPAGDWTVMYVARKLASDSDGRLFDGHSGNYLIGYHGPNKRSIYLAGNPSNYSTGSGAATNVGVTDFEMQCFVRETAGDINLYVNGNTNYNYPGTTNDAAGIIWDLNQGNHSGESSDSQVGEFIIVPSALTSSDRESLEGYLAHKWGLAANLPADHPYKDAAPGVSGVAIPLTDATVTDEDEGAELTQNWTLVSKPAGAADPTFSDATAVNPTVTFTATGTYELSLTANDGIDSHSDNIIITINDPSTGGTVKNDFNGDGKSDVLLRHNTDGRWYMHTLNGSSVLSSGFSNMVTSTSWSFKGTGDFDGDGKSDVLLRHNTDGRWYMHTLNGSSVLSSGFSNMVTSTSWSFKGTGDFDGDGKSDVLLRHNTDGRWYMHTLNGSAVLSSGFSNMVTSTSWSFKGTGDFDGDGKSDVLLRHNTDGRWYMHTLNGSAVLSSGFSNMVTSTSWSFKGTGDFDGDGKSDVLLRHNTDGRWYMHTLNGSAVLSSGFSNMVTSTNWSFKGTGDFDGDGKSDVLLRHNTDGRWYMHTLNGSSVLSSGFSDMVTSTNWAFANNQSEQAPEGQDAAAVLHTTESILSDNDSYEDLAVVLDALSVSNEAGDFSLKVITTEGEFIFYLSTGEEFSYAVLSDNEFSVTYTDSDEILEMLSRLFDADDILDIQVMAYTQ